MPFDWREYLLLAHELQKDHRESAQRACLGRTYYYVYHLGLSAARNRKFTGTLPGLHAKLWDWCQKQQDRDIKKLGSLGNRLKSRRIEADYYDSRIDNLLAEVQLQLTRARKFEELVAKVEQRTSPPPINA